jgi:Holliday junction resolvase RusA-like endonuclease
MKTIKIEIDLVPRGKERVAPGRFKPYLPKKTVDYEEVIRNACQEQAFLEGFEPLQHFAEVRIQARMPVPQSLSKKKQQALLDGVKYTKKPDADNIEKSALDAMNKVIYIDDRIVWDLGTRKIYSENPGLTITVTGM